MKDFKTLVKGSRYIGKYVAMKSCNERTILASGEDRAAVVRRAQDKGVESPLIIFVPKENFQV